MERRFQPPQPDQKHKMDRPTAIVRQFLGDPQIREKLIDPKGDFWVRHKAKNAIISLDNDGLTALTEKLTSVIANKDKNLKQHQLDGASILLSYTMIQKSNRNEENIPESEVERRRGQVRVLWENNLTQEQIAQELGTSRKVVEKDLSRMRKKGEEIPLRAPKPLPSEVADRRKKVKELDAQGFTPKEIAEELGEDRAVVRRDLYLQKKNENAA